jgi:hypothetical protein
MQRSIRNNNIFPAEVLALFRALHLAGFFEESMLIGSWVMPLYQEVFDIHYVLRTLDVAFAVKFASPGRDKGADIENLITGQRRSGESKKDKDLEQCAIIARHIDHDRFKAVAGSLKLSKKTRAAMLISCEVIGFPPQALGLR